MVNISSATEEKILRVTIQRKRYKMVQVKVFAFIDSQNLHLGVKEAGWSLDFRKFRLYLKNKYDVERAYLFIGQMPGNETLYRHLQEMGYILIFKPTMQYKKAGRIEAKGNVDAELVLYASAITFNDYDKLRSALELKKTGISGRSKP